MGEKFASPKQPYLASQRKGGKLNKGLSIKKKKVKETRGEPKEQTVSRKEREPGGGRGVSSAGGKRETEISHPAYEVERSNRGGHTKA